MRYFVFLITLGLIMLWCINVSQGEIKKIPQRVYFSKVESSSSLPDDIISLVKYIPEFLYTEISSKHNIVRVYKPDTAHSTVNTRCELDQNKVIIMIILKGVNGEIQKSSYEMDMKNTNLEDFINYLKATADFFSKYLFMVEPEIRIQKVLKENRMEKIVKVIDYKERLNKRHEITLWAGGLMSLYHEGTIDDPGPIKYDDIRLLPIRLDYAVFPRRDLGYLISIMFDSNSLLSFGSIYQYIYNTDGQIIGFERQKASLSENRFFLLGGGISYRTLYRFSAGFELIFYLGAVRVKAIDPLEKNIYEDNGFNLEPGEIGWLPYLLFTFSPQLSINITPNISLKTRFSINLSPSSVNTALSQDYDSDYSILFFNFCPVGMCVRF